MLVVLHDLNKQQKGNMKKLGQEGRIFVFVFLVDWELSYIFIKQN